MKSLLSMSCVFALVSCGTIHPGKLPRAADGVHYSPEGYIRLGQITASAVEENYKKR